MTTEPAADTVERAARAAALHHAGKTDAFDRLGTNNEHESNEDQR